MQRRTLLLPVAALCLALAVSCGPSFRHVQERSMTEAQLLRDEVNAKNIAGSEVEAANGYLNKANVTASAREAADFADIAAAHYRVALANHSLEASRVSMAQAEASLKASEEQVVKYEKILASVSARRGEKEE